MDVYVSSPMPVPHRPLAMDEVGNPPLGIPEEPGEIVEAEVAMRASDKLAEEAGVDPAVLATTERQEWYD